MLLHRSRHNNITVTSFIVYLFTMPAILVYVKLWQTAHVQQFNCCVKKRHTLLRPTCGLQTAPISIVWITRYGLSCSIVSTTDKLIVWMNWNGGSSISGAVLNSRFWRHKHHTTCLSHYRCSFHLKKSNFICIECWKKVILFALNVPIKIVLKHDRKSLACRF